jgi:RNA polymerase-binding protein DksA
MGCMNDQQRKDIEARLERREQDLQATIDGLREQVATPVEGVGQEVRDSVEDGDARMQAALDVEQLRRQEAQLLDVRAARQRLREGDYGHCEECGVEIPFARLQARPEARLCIQHEEEWEKAHPEPGTLPA